MTAITYRHWRDVPSNRWRWKNFSPAEIACRGTGKLLINEPALDKLQALRDRLGKPLIVRSAYRSSEHNRAVDGATRSKHKDGAAFESPWRTTILWPSCPRHGTLGSSALASIRARASCTSTSARRVSRANGSLRVRCRSRPRSRPCARSWRRAAPRKAVARRASRRSERLASRWRSRCWRRRRPPSCRSSRISICSAGCSSRSRSTPGSTTGSGGVGDWRTRRHARRIGMGARSAPLRHHRPRDPSVPAGPAPLRRAGWSAGRTAQDHGENP